LTGEKPVMIICLYNKQCWFLCWLVDRSVIICTLNARAVWRKLHNEELHSLYSSPNIIRQIQVKANEVGRACGTHGIGEKSVQGFSGKARSKEPLGRPSHRWEDGIRMDLMKIGCGGVDWTGSG
jgi:hypothetical protein